MFLESLGETAVLRLFPGASLLLARAYRAYAGNADNEAENVAMEPMAVAFAALGALGRAHGMANFIPAMGEELNRICAALDVE